jgi:hypothetical protein
LVGGSVAAVTGSMYAGAPRQRRGDWAADPEEEEGMMPMNAFIVEAANRPGELAKVTEILAARGVNLLVSSLGSGDRGLIGFIADNEETSRSALKDAGIAYQETPIIHVRAEDRPGETAAVTRKLAEGGVNVEFLVPVDTNKANFICAFGVDNVEAAEKVLGDQVTTFSYT